MMSTERITNLHTLSTLYHSAGTSLYGGEAISQLEHGLQAAYAAEQDGAPVALIIAALLHDVGHLLTGQQDDDLANGIDDRHEAIGASALHSLFGPAVYQPIALHVAAKRYLCATDAGYLAQLSPASRCSLALQGGPMQPEEVAQFRQRAYASEALALRRYDELAKVPQLATPPLSHYLALAQQLITPTPSPTPNTGEAACSAVEL